MIRFSSFLLLSFAGSNFILGSSSFFCPSQISENNIGTTGLLFKVLNCISFDILSVLNSILDIYIPLTCKVLKISTDFKMQVSNVISFKQAKSL